MLGTVAAPGAEEASLDTILVKMEQAEQKIEAVQFDYQQDINYTLTGEKQTNSGQVIFQKPNNLYIKQLNPVPQMIIANGKKVWVYTPSYNQVATDSWQRWMKSSLVPASLLNLGQNWAEMKKNYAFTSLGTEGEDYLLLLSPKKKGADDWKMKLWIDSKEFIPHKASLLGGNISITTETKNYKVNPQIDKNMFNFRPPPRTEVINIP